MENRISWPEVWMSLADTIAKRSYDSRLQVGCVIVSDDNTSVLAVGYNGNAHGLPNQRESEEPGMSGFIHAEANALIKLDYHNPSKKIVYLTHSPCPICAKLLIQAKISKVVYGRMFRDPTGLDVLKQGNIEFEIFKNTYNHANSHSL